MATICEIFHLPTHPMSWLEHYTYDDGDEWYEIFNVRSGWQRLTFREWADLRMWAQLVLDLKGGRSQ